MEIFQREKYNQIEGINIKDLNDILHYRSDSYSFEIDSIIFDTILLRNNTKIKCIKNYYCNLDNNVPKKTKSSNTCSAIQKFYNVSCAPYKCDMCHRIMLDMRKNKQVKVR